MVIVDGALTPDLSLGCSAPCENGSPGKEDMMKRWISIFVLALALTMIGSAVVSMGPIAPGLAYADDGGDGGGDGE